MGLIDKLTETVENYLKETEYELVLLSYQREGGGYVLRIMIDKEGGVNLDDCATVSRGISPVLDEEDIIADDSYILEVSSPGVDRPLVKLNDFERFKDNDVKIVLKEPLKSFDEKRIRYKGFLNGVKDGNILLLLDNREVLIPYDKIKKANIIYKF